MHNEIKKFIAMGIFAISCGLFSICNGYDYKYQLNNSKYVEIIDNERTITTQGAVNWSDYSRNIDSIGNVETTYQGDTEIGAYLPINNSYNSLANTLSVFWNNDKLYYYSKNYMQGYFKYFCTGTINSTSFANCLSTNNGGIIDYNNYQTYISSGTLQPIETFNNNEQYHNNIVAFFYVDSNGQGNYNASEPPFGFIYSDNTFVAFPIIQKATIDQTNPNNGYNLTGTLGINLEQPMNFTKFKSFNNLKEEAPTISGGGPGQEGGPISCVNIQTQIMLYGSKYNTGMCYTNGLTYSGVQLVQTGKQSIFELYQSLNDFRNALNIYSTYCNPNSPTTPEYCQQQMNQYSEYTYQFYNYLQQANNNSTAFSVESEKLYQYCHLQLDYTEEEKRNNCKETVDNYYATGVNEETANGNPFDGLTERVENNIQIAVPQTGTVFDEFLEGDMWNISITDRYNNFIEIFHKITGLFKYRATQQGIIPGYITGLIMLILLLALFKK